MTDPRQPTQLLARIQARMGQSFDGDYFTLANALRALNDAQDAIHAEIERLDVGWFLTDTTVSTVANQKDYALPANCRIIKRLAPASNARNELAIPYEIYPATQTDSIGRGIILIDDAFRMVPTPTTVFSMEMQFIRSAQAMHYGTLAAASANTCTLDASPTAGDVSAVDDYYNHAYILTTGGTGSGQLRKITDYIGDTRVCTVDTAWTVTPDATTTYEILSSLESDEAEVLVLAAMENLMSDDTDAEAFQRNYGLQLIEGLRQLKAKRARRQTSNNLKWKIKR